MKYIRFGPIGHEQPGIVDPDGIIRDISTLTTDIGPGFITSGGLLSLDRATIDALPVVPSDVRLGCPIAGIGKVIGIGLNYRAHAREANSPIPTEPIIFLKANTSISGPFDNVELPRTSEKADWEVELGIVIGKRAKYVSTADALDYVFGYCVVNDVSERGHQLERGGQWTKGKSHDTFCPIGPWLVSRDEVKDVQALRLWCDVNAVRRQDSNTSDMIFTAAQCVSYVSQFMTLMPGDVITTGTPQGVGLGQKPPLYLSVGDVMRLGVEGLGEQSQKVVGSH